MSAAQTPAASSGAKVVDSGHTAYPTLLHIKLTKDGGSVTIPSHSLAKMTGVDMKKLGPCAAALALDHMKITGSNMPIDSHLIVSAGNGKPISAHSANHVTHDGSIHGVHANIRHGNRHGGTNIIIKLQPHDGVYRKKGTRKELMQNAIKTAENWAEHRGKKAADIERESVDTVRQVSDASGTTHVRALVHKHSLVGKLVEMNPDSAHPVMSLYSKKKIKEHLGKIIMDHAHVKQLAATLEETLAPCTDVSEHGLKITVKPMQHSTDHMVDGEPLLCQLDAVIVRDNVATILHDEKDQTHTTAVTTDDIGSAVGAGTTRQEIDDAMFGGEVGGQKIVGKVEAHDVDGADLTAP